jgi:hypothetical protein
MLACYFKGVIPVLLVSSLEDWHSSFTRLPKYNIYESILHSLNLKPLETAPLGY